MANYFPNKNFNEIQNVHNFIVHWYSSHLNAMNEPSFIEMCQNKGIHNYRFLWLRSFDKPICVRIEIIPDGSAFIIVKMTTGKGGYGPGELEIDTTYTISKNKVKTLLGFLEKTDFWNLPIKDNNMGRDGANWIIEGVKKGKYHIVDRWSPEKGAFREAALYMIKLSGLNVKEIY